MAKRQIKDIEAWFIRQRMLAAAAQGGDESAFKVLLEDHQPLIRLLSGKILSQYRNSNLTMEILEAEGAAGLWQAVTRYDTSRTTPFFHYAKHWIRYFLQRLAKSESRLGGRGPRHSVCVSPGKPVVDSEADAYSEWLDIIMTSEGDDSLNVDIDEELDAQKVSQKLKRVVATLPGPQWFVIHQFFISDQEPKRQEIADTLGVSTQAIQQMKLKALEKLKKRLQLEEE